MEFSNILDLIINTAQAASEAAPAAKEGGVIGTLGINWKLFLAQLVNFSIILALLYRYVFTPIGKKLEERADKIDKALKDAEDIEKGKEEFEVWKGQELIGLKKKAAAEIEKARSEGEAEKARVLGEAKLEMSKMREQTQFQLSAEKKQALTDIKKQAAEMITLAAEKVIKEKLDSKKDQELIHKILSEIK